MVGPHLYPIRLPQNFVLLGELSIKPVVSIIVFVQSPSLVPMYSLLLILTLKISVLHVQACQFVNVFVRSHNSSNNNQWTHYVNTKELQLLTLPHRGTANCITINTSCFIKAVLCCLFLCMYCSSQVTILSVSQAPSPY